ncbi:isopenicillin N synthase family dioxygenase [Amnibacterium kyonggiense]|uniref:Isopenicillin N synthase-like dioxygenase n=1 Tax=Amnibacterium kyonggiense TaxID=595671 RepID=A0A4R7FPN9_9MICO|nr:2-oxoglutarate and iron-dependent oxygenase domain-containing protein [Amnibacterium kyonggiense]TDS79626.1 isopenicillin N synthase-like dioxygenase [Amnibacterium kyonggiense]
MTDPTPFQVPVVDIAPYGDPHASREERLAVARRLDEAARTVGFLQVTGHGVSAEAWDGLGSVIDDFFGLPLDVKKAYIAPPGVNRGYTAPKSERLSLSLGVEKAERMNDFFEAYNVGIDADRFPDLPLDRTAYAPNRWPDEVDAFATRVQAWMAEVDVVAHRLLAVFEDALSLPAGYFDRFTDHSLNVLRMNNYALPPGERIELDGDLIGMGEHTDFGIVTLLWADDVKGLQVLAADGGWHDVSPLPGALLINFGDLMARWTNERWRSTLHRVKPPIVDGTIRRRRSAAFFLDGNHDAVIAALPGVVAAGERPLYPPITVAEHIDAKLRGSRGLEVVTTGTEREAERVVASRG